MTTYVYMYIHRTPQYESRTCSRREEARTVTTRRERPVREVDANEFDRKSSPPDPHYRSLKSSREVNSRMRKRELRAMYPRCLCHSGDNPIAESIGDPRECLLLGNREVKLIVSYLSSYKVSYVYEIVYVIATSNRE